VNSFARSGRPYTPSSNSNDVNGRRTPPEYNTNVRISKTLGNFFGSTATFYLEVFNVFNDRIYNYNYLFNTANKVDQNANLANYENYAWADPAHGVLYWDDQNIGNAYPLNHEFLLFDNAPRSFQLGLTIEF
jgi:hypothetical protein